MLAVIQTGGKQYVVAPGQKVKVEKLDKKEGDEAIFDKVLLMEKSNHVEIGTPFIDGAKVTGKVIKQGKADKVIIFKYKAKKRTRSKAGHRQTFTEVEIKSIG
jgi:large subunit ribosomal protein L21